MTTAGKNRIMISPKSDGTYVIEFTTAAAESLAISSPGTEAAVMRHFQERMPYGLFVPEMDAARDSTNWCPRSRKVEIGDYSNGCRS